MVSLKQMLSVCAAVRSFISQILCSEEELQRLISFHLFHLTNRSIFYYLFSTVFTLFDNAAADVCSMKPIVL